MDGKIVSFGKAITQCQRRSECPGIRAKTVLNDPANGVPPRGLFLRPATAALVDVQLVILGQNPGAAGGFERVLNRFLYAQNADELFESVHAATIEATWDIEYWKRLDTLARGLVGSGELPIVLGLEVAFCQTVAGERWPGSATMKFCSRTHLAPIAKEIPDGTPWLCVGGPARDWFQEADLSRRFPWAWTEHVTGTRGTYRAMVEKSGSLKARVKSAWTRVLERKEAGLCLSRLEKDN